MQMGTGCSGQGLVSHLLPPISALEVVAAQVIGFEAQLIPFVLATSRLGRNTK